MKMDENKLIVSKSELQVTQQESMVLNEAQMGLLLKKTPKKYIRKRPAKGGGQWDYVSGGYVKKTLNLMFGWNWSFEIKEKDIVAGEAIVHGRLTATSNGKTIIKEQFGNKEIIYKNEPELDQDGNKVFYEDHNGNKKVKMVKTDKPLSIGNDFKAAATDCLKKCAAEIGIAADIYNPEEFREVKIVEDKDLLIKLKQLFEDNAYQMSEDYQMRVAEIIRNEEEESYQKIINEIEKLDGSSTANSSK